MIPHEIVRLPRERVGKRIRDVSDSDDEVVEYDMPAQPEYDMPLPVPHAAVHGQVDGAIVGVVNPIVAVDPFPASDGTCTRTHFTSNACRSRCRLVIVGANVVVVHIIVCSVVSESCV